MPKDNARYTMEEFFEVPRDIVLLTGEIGATRITQEELYQHFRARLIKELVVDVPNTSHYGRLVPDKTKG